MRHQKRTTLPITLALSLMASTACSVSFDALTSAADHSGTPAIIVVAGVPALAIGQSTKLNTVVKDADGKVITDASISWGNSAPNVASILADGTVTALSAGTVTFTAVSGPAQGSVTITVSATTGAPTPPPTPPASGTPSSATLPNTSTVATTMPTGGHVTSVPANADLQAYINAAPPGEILELPAGATYTGNFILPDKGPSTEWIIIRPASTVALPPAGQRMTPQIAAALSLPRIVTPNGANAIQTALSAHHYWLVGLDVTVDPTVGQAYGLIGLGSDGSQGQTTDASIAHHLTLDRMYIHGATALPLRRCVALNSAVTGIIDSWINECHDAGADAQAICGWNGPGPYKIINNHLEASTEIIMFGGSDPKIVDMAPSDIEIRHNHLTRPLSWKGKWLEKNIFELKNARRVLVEGNVMENSWLDAQGGVAVVIKSVNQDNTAPWSGTTDVTFRYNIIRNIGSGFALAASPENKPTIHLQRVDISNNLVTNMNTADFNGSALGFITNGDIADMKIDHNTVTGPWLGLELDGYGVWMSRFDFTNNVIATVNAYGLAGQQTGYAGPSWTTFSPGGTLAGNVFAVGAAYSTGGYDSYGPANLLMVNADPNFGPLGFTNYGSGDLSLLPTSPAKGKAVGGGDPGVDMTALRAATNGAVTP